MTLAAGLLQPGTMYLLLCTATSLTCTVSIAGDAQPFATIDPQGVSVVFIYSGVVYTSTA